MTGIATSLTSVLSHRGACRSLGRALQRRPGATAPVRDLNSSDLRARQAVLMSLGRILTESTVAGFSGKGRPTCPHPDLPPKNAGRFMVPCRAPVDPIEDGDVPWDSVDRRDAVSTVGEEVFTDGVACTA